MIRAAICDDDINIINQIRTWLQDISEDRDLDIDIKCYRDGLDIVKATDAGEFFHIIFMDVEMDGLDGLKAAERIRKKEWQTLIIYISNYQDYAIQCFEARPFDYVLKPLDEHKFHEVFQKAYKEILRYRTEFVFESGRRQVQLQIRKILYFESDDKKVKAHFSDHVEEFTAKLDEVEKELAHSDYPFIRIHKSYLISYRYIVSISPETVQLKDETVLQISRRRRELVSQQYRELVMRTRGH